MLKKALVLGLGKSGQGAVFLLQSLGYEIVGVDQKPMRIEGISFFLEGEPLPFFDFDLVILSPGIALSDHPLAQQAEEKGIEIIGEAELGIRHLSNKMIGITGTNGKTTLTLLVTHVLNQCKQKARALGNIGNSIAEYAIDANSEEILVIELSSFQLETMQKGNNLFDIGVITSITPDHLDRYPSFEAYAQTKCHLSDLIKESGWLVVSREIARTYQGQLNLKIRQSISPCDLKTQAFSICEKLGISSDSFEDAYATFSKPLHRLEYIGEINGVSFYNDSKATNPEAVLFALEQIKSPVILIAGGLAKTSTFKLWKEPFTRKVKEVIAVGNAAPLIARDLNLKKIYSSLKEGLLEGFRKAKRGDVVLLSPGCASFDEFKNYEERGEMFKKMVKTLRRSQ